MKDTYQQFLESGGEKKWQGVWEEKKTFAVKEDETKEKFYSLIEFNYKISYWRYNMQIEN